MKKIIAIEFPGGRKFRVGEKGVTSIEVYWVRGEMSNVIRYRVRHECGLEVTGPQRLAITEEVPA